MRRILLYGRSLWFSGLATYLQGLEGWQVVQADAPGWETPTAFADVGLVLLDCAHEAEALPLLRAHRATAVVSVDASTGLLTILFGQSCRVQTMQEIEQLVRDMMPARASPLPTWPADPTDLAAPDSTFPPQHISEP
jgi:hypothetical protein